MDSDDEDYHSNNTRLCFDTAYPLHAGCAAWGRYAFLRLQRLRH